jgi:hypothetical protein
MNIEQNKIKTPGSRIQQKNSFEYSSSGKVGTAKRGSTKSPKKRRASIDGKNNSKA